MWSARTTTEVGRGPISNRGARELECEEDFRKRIRMLLKGVNYQSPYETRNIPLSSSSKFTLSCAVQGVCKSKTERSLAS